MSLLYGFSLGAQPQWQPPYGMAPWGMPMTAQQAADQQLAAMGVSAPEAPAAAPRGPTLMKHQPATRKGEPTCLTARNFLNTQYTVNVGVGSGRFWMVPDSGSFEVLVPSSNCRDCRCVHSRSACCKSGIGKGGDSKNVYTQAMPGLAQTAKRVDVTFGQGVVTGRIAHDMVTLGSSTAENQSLLLAESHHVQGYCEGSYDGVLGLGHRRYAREGDADTALLATLGLSSFSICYGRNEDDPGRLILGGGVPGLHYREVPVVGTRHWAVQLVGVGFGADTGAVCAEGQRCGAIIDSGTSLIAGPRNLMQVILDQLGNGVEEDCSNVDSLPNLTFRLGSPDNPMDFVLPPRMYVTRSREEAEEPAPPSQESYDDMTGFLSGKGELPPGVFSAAQYDPAAPPQTPQGIRHELTASSSSNSSSSSSSSSAGSAAGGSGKKKAGREKCMVVFMELNMEDRDYGPVWILGMPFMRAFSARFSRNGAGADGATGGGAGGADSDWRKNLTVGLAEIPPDQNLCAGCPTDTDAAHHDTMAGLGVMSLAATHSGGGHGEEQGQHAAAGGMGGDDARPLSVSLRNARLPGWAVGLHPGEDLGVGGRPAAPVIAHQPRARAAAMQEHERPFKL